MTITNYLKARFHSAEAATTALPALRAFVREGIDARDYWQAHRHLEQRGQRQVFWLRFAEQFPAIHAYLGALADGDCDQALLGFLEFGHEQTNELYVEGALLFFKAPGLWLGTDWELLSDYLKSHLQAAGVAWIGDDPGIDFFDLLQP